MAALTDEELLERTLRLRDMQSYAELVDRHKYRAMTLAVRLLKHQEEAEEALQDAFLKAYRFAGSFDRRARFATWFYRIVYNTCLSRLERLRTSAERLNVTELSDGVELASPISTDASAIRREQQQAIEAAIRRLPEHLATVVTLFYVQELSYDEIVEVTGMPLGTVKTHLFRARAALRTSLQKTLVEGNEVL